MRVHFPIVAFVLSSSLLGCAPPEGDSVGTDTHQLEPQGDDHGKPEPPMLGVHHERGEAGRPSGGGSDPNLKYKGGNILSSVVIQPIFWGTSWGNPSFVADKRTGLEQLYNAYAGSGYARTNTEYTGVGGQVTATDITVDPQIVDLSAGPRNAPKTSAILAEVCKMIATPVANGYYPVYTDTPRGSAGYCAWHSWGACNGVNIQFGFFFKLDGDAGCDPQDTTPGRSQGLAALANVSGHELSETVTDPRGTGWLDTKGSENSDKCAWMFDQDVTLSDTSVWKIQGNWSNAAYTAGTGLPNRDGQKGCLYNN